MQAIKTIQNQEETIMKKGLTFLLAGAMSIGLLAGCGQGGQPQAWLSIPQRKRFMGLSSRG